ncbi:hypothetical protein IMSAGC019_01148 [Lachnospiraceae bacterium]|nr:hypothetical protein IMSAGC019_01148 [Lachnospiraceae bacterium]
MQNDWMKDETLRNIEPYKLEFLQALVFESSNLKKGQMIPFLMAVAKRGQEKKISFSDDEINAIVAVLRKHATPEETAKIEKIMSMRPKK